MSDAISAPPARFAVASQWLLMWWAFRRHRLAMAGLVVTILLYIVAAVPGFFAVNDPAQQNARTAYHPPQAMHFLDWGEGALPSLRPYIHPYTLKRDPVSLASIYTEDRSRKVHLDLFGQGYEYSVLGLFSTRVHLFASCGAKAHFLKHTTSWVKLPTCGSTAMRLSSL